MDAEQLYPDTVFNFNNLTVGQWDYTWYFGDGTKVAEKEPNAHTYNKTGQYSVSLVASGKRCADSLVKLLLLKPRAPIARFSAVENGCMPHTVNLFNQSLYAQNYFWEFGDGSVSNSPTQAIPTTNRANT
ncbi:MAG: PKD domain-containing protein [Bacteroidales bacterium]|nr:PKD domain-containing protein [Bacteroidales bacterium]